MLRAAVLAVLAMCPPAAALACEDSVVRLRSENSSAQFTVTVARTPEEQARGLMFVEDLPRFEGMLFVNETPRRAMFWMKNTLIPLDMLFVDETGTVTVLHENAVPHSEDTIDGGSGVKAVLEINGGMAATLSLGPGTELQHPAFDQSLAAWPCSE